MSVFFEIAELTRLDVKPGEVLAVKLIGDMFDEEASLDSLKLQLQQVFPNNRVMVFALPNNSDLQFQTIKGSDVPAQNYCNDCSCGKKSKFEELNVDDLIKELEKKDG